MASNAMRYRAKALVGMIIRPKGNAVTGNVWVSGVYVCARGIYVMLAKFFIRVVENLYVTRYPLPKRISTTYFRGNELSSKRYFKTRTRANVGNATQTVAFGMVAEFESAHSHLHCSFISVRGQKGARLCPYCPHPHHAGIACPLCGCQLVGYAQFGVLGGIDKLADMPMCRKCGHPFHSGTYCAECWPEKCTYWRTNWRALAYVRERGRGLWGTVKVCVTHMYLPVTRQIRKKLSLGLVQANTQTHASTTATMVPSQGSRLLTQTEMPRSWSSGQFAGWIYKTPMRNQTRMSQATRNAMVLSHHSCARLDARVRLSSKCPSPQGCSERSSK